MLDKKNNDYLIEILQCELLNWFAKAKRDLPFRRTKDPYFIWISEIMAQQTQIDTLIPYYNRFIEKFPNVFTLASASADAVIKAWEGLGYYSRARNLHQAAKIIVRDYDGLMPGQFSELIKLPGIGPYTGGAIASIAFNEQVSAVDGNVLRVISRYCNSLDDIGDAKTKKTMTAWIETILPAAAGDFNEGLMELGAIICTPQSPKCLICPLRTGCQSFASGTTAQIPIKKKKQKQLTKKMEVGIVKQNNTLFFIRRPDAGLLSSMWSFPITETTAGNGLDIKTKLRDYFPELCDPVLLGTSRHVFSHIIWDMSVYGFDLDAMVCESPNLPYHSGLAGESAGQTDQTTFKAVALVDDLALPIAFSKLLTLIDDFCGY